MLGESKLPLSSQQVGPLLVVQYKVVWTQKRHTKIKMCSVGYISVYCTHTHIKYNQRKRGYQHEVGGMRSTEGRREGLDKGEGEIK